VIKVRGDIELSQRMIEIEFKTAMRTKKMIQELEGGQWSFQTSVKIGPLKAVAEEQGLKCKLREKVEQAQVASR